MVAAVFSTIGEPLARDENVSTADFGAFTPQDPRSGSCAAPRSRSAVEAVVAPVSGAERRGSVTARVPTPRRWRWRSARLSAGPGRHAYRSSTVSREPIGAAHRVTLFGQLHRRATPACNAASRIRCAVLAETPP